MLGSESRSKELSGFSKQNKIVSTCKTFILLNSDTSQIDDLCINW